MADNSPEGIVQPPVQEAEAQPEQSPDSLTSQEAESTNGEGDSKGTQEEQPQKQEFQALSPEEQLKETRKFLQEQGEKKNKAFKQVEEITRRWVKDNPNAINDVIDTDPKLAAKIAQEDYGMTLKEMLGKLATPQPEAKDFNPVVSKFLDQDDGELRKMCESDGELNKALGRQYTIFKKLPVEDQIEELLNDMLDTAKIAYITRGSGERMAKSIMREEQQRKAASLQTGSMQNASTDTKPKSNGLKILKPSKSPQEWYN